MYVIVHGSLHATDTHSIWQVKGSMNMTLNIAEVKSVERMHPYFFKIIPECTIAFMQAYTDLAMREGQQESAGSNRVSAHK